MTLTYSNFYGRKRVGQRFFKPSMTDQSLADECSIERIVERSKRGINPPLNSTIGQFLDVSSVPDLQQYFQIAADAADAFASLPSALRAELDNDPRRIVELTYDDFKRYGLTKSLPSQPADSGFPGGQPGSEPAARKASKKPTKSPQIDSGGDNEDA